MIGIGVKISISLAGITSSFDADAQAYFDRVTTAGGTLTTTEKTAVNQLVIDMKANGTWTPMKAIYPMVGSSAAACAQNLKSSSFTGTFSASGWSYLSTGVLNLGSGEFNTGLNLNTMNSISDISYGYYCRTNSLSSGSFGWGVPSPLSPLNEFWIRYNDSNKYGYLSDSANDGGVVSDCRGFNAMSRIASNIKYIQINSTIATFSSASSGSLVSRNFIFGRGSQGYEDRQNALGFVGDGITSTQMNNFYTAVQTFNQTLNRQVGAQIVSDSDAQAYINRVYTAGGNLTNTEANAVNQLTIDMKSANVWTAMKAVYPMVGSSAAACAQNLKSSSFTGTFSSGWTFASTGVTPNGTSAYMDTTLNPSTSLTNSSGHFSYYSRLDTAAGNKYEIANYAGAFGNALIIKYTSNIFYAAYGQYNANTTNTDSRGFFVTNRNSLTNTTGFKNGTKLIDTITTGTTANRNIILGAEAYATISGFTDRQCAFASIGDGLTDAQASDFYTNVQTFNTTLSRQV